MSCFEHDFSKQNRNRTTVFLLLCPMNIAFDAKRLFFNNTGLGNYARWVTETYSKYYPTDQLSLFSPFNAKQSKIDSLIQRENIKVIQYPNRLGYTRVFGMGEMLKPYDIFHGLSNELPHIPHFKGKKITTIHDVIFKARPQDYSVIDRFIYSKKVDYACRHSDIILTISNISKNDLINYFNADPKKIILTYCTPDSAFKAPSDTNQLENLKKRYKLPSEYWITVASFHPRKNQESILNAYQYIPENKRIPLVFTGEGKNKNKLLELSTAKGLEKWVYPVGHIPTEHLISLLHGSKGLLYPSLYEGFGLPALEALQLEVPVIAHRGTSLEEVCGLYGNYVDTLNAEEFAETLMQMGQSPKPNFAKDPGFLAHLSNFSTEKLVSDLHKIYYK